MATLRDIAGRLDLSTAVVSRVLNGKADVWASETTKKRIFDVANELGYRPSATARALSTGRTMQLGVIVGEAQLYPHLGFHGGEVGGMMIEALRQHYRVSLLPLESGLPGEQQLRHWVQERTCDGFCVFTELIGSRAFAVLRDSSLPRVLIGDPAESDDTMGATVVDVDNYNYAHVATQWLQNEGHSKVAWATAVGEGDQPHSKELRRGYDNAMVEGNGTPCFWPYSDDDGCLVERARSGEATAAIVRGMHGLVRWVIHLLDGGMRLPQDFALMALLSEAEHDAALLGGLSRFCAIHTHVPSEVGRRAAQLLMQGIAGETLPKRALVVPSDSPQWGGRSRPST